MNKIKIILLILFIAATGIGISNFHKKQEQRKTFLLLLDEYRFSGDEKNTGVTINPKQLPEGLSDKPFPQNIDELKILLGEYSYGDSSSQASVYVDELWIKNQTSPTAIAYSGPKYVHKDNAISQKINPDEIKKSYADAKTGLASVISTIKPTTAPEPTFLLPDPTTIITEPIPTNADTLPIITQSENKPIELALIPETAISDKSNNETMCPYITDNIRTISFAVYPVPSPTPNTVNYGAKTNICKDTRTWTKFAYSEIIEKVSTRYRLDPQLIYATIMTESEGDVYAYRYEPHINDQSLCMGQILTSTARRLGFTGETDELYRPEICIDLIGRYHRNMLDEFGDLTPEQLAIAYNAGSPYKYPVPGHLYRFDIWYSGGEI